MKTALPSQPRRPLPPQPSLSAPEAAWSRFAPYRADIVRSMRSRGQDDATAEDLAQEAIVRASLAPSGRSNLGRPRAWLERIALNLLRDHLRPRSTELLPLGDSEDPRLGGVGREPIPGDDVETSWVRTEHGLVRASLLVDDLHGVLDELPSLQRRALQVYYLEGRSMGELAERLSTRPSIAKCLLYRARRALHARLTRRGVLAQQIRRVA